MRRRPSIVAVVVTIGIVPLGSACESTADRAAQRRAAQAAEAARLAELAAAAEALKVVRVQGIETTVLAVLNAPDAGLAAVVVGMKSSDPKRSVVWAPIDVKLKDASGAVIAENNIDGALPSLVHVPSLPASGEAFYVNDQLAPDPPEAVPASADVVLGGEMVPLDPPPEPLETSSVRLVEDPDLGANFTGTVVNSTPVRQEQLIVQAIVRKAGEVVAAGTAVVEGLDPGQSAEFTGFFVGDPSGGELEVIVPPSNWPGADGAPAPAAEGNPDDAGTGVLTDDGAAAPDDAGAETP
jgi:hypothetical protein